MCRMEEDFFCSLATLGKLYRRFCRDAAAEYCFTPNEVAVLLFLHDAADGQDTATEIALAHGISKALVARSVCTLEKRGFVRSARDVRDRRVVHLRLTEAGGQAAVRLSRNRDHIFRCMEQGVSDEELLLLKQILKKMRCNLDALLETEEGTVNHND